MTNKYFMTYTYKSGELYAGSYNSIEEAKVAIPEIKQEFIDMGNDSDATWLTQGVFSICTEDEFIEEIEWE